MFPLHRISGAFQRPEANGEWTYFRQWWAYAHPQAGIAYYFDMPGHKDLNAAQVAALAVAEGLDVKADEALLHAFGAFGIH